MNNETERNGLSKDEADFWERAFLAALAAVRVKASKLGSVDAKDVAYFAKYVADEAVNARRRSI